MSYPRKTTPSRQQYLAMGDIAVVLVLFAVAGGGIIVIDALIIRRLRRGK